MWWKRDYNQKYQNSLEWHDGCTRSHHSFTVNEHYFLASSRHRTTSLYIFLSIWFPFFSLFTHADKLFIDSNGVEKHWIKVLAHRFVSSFNIFDNLNGQNIYECYNLSRDLDKSYKFWIQALIWTLLTWCSRNCSDYFSTLYIHV